MKIEKIIIRNLEIEVTDEAKANLKLLLADICKCKPSDVSFRIISKEQIKGEFNHGLMPKDTAF